MTFIIANMENATFAASALSLSLSHTQSHAVARSHMLKLTLKRAHSKSAKHGQPYTTSASIHEALLLATAYESEILSFDNLRRKTGRFPLHKQEEKNN